MRAGEEGRRLCFCFNFPVVFWLLGFFFLETYLTEVPEVWL